MAKLKQTFRNNTDRPMFVNLELSTSRFRLAPGEELILFYDPADGAVDEHDATLQVGLVPGSDGVELVVWTVEDTLLRPDGSAAPLDYGRA